MKAKRFLSLVLSFLLVMSSFGTVAFADTEAAGEVASDIPAGFELVKTVESDGEIWEYYVYAGAEAQAETTATVSAYKQVEGPADVEVDGKYFELVNSDIGGNGALESGVTAIKNTNATGGLILVSEGTLVVNNRQDITMDNIIIKGAGESLTTITGDSASFNNTSNGLASSNLKTEYKALIGLPNTVKLMDLTVDGGNCGVVTVQTGLFGIKTYSRADFKVIRANGNSNGTAVSYMENVTAKGDQSRAVIMVGSTSTKTTVYGKALTVVEPKSQGTLDLDRKSVENEGGSIVKLENSFIDGMIIGSAEGLGKGYYKLKTSTGVVVYTTIPKAIEVCNEGYADLIAEYCTNDDIEEGASVAEAMVNDLTTRINGETTLLYGKNCEEMKALTVEFKASLDNIKNSVSVDTDALYEKLNAALAISSWHIADEDGNCKTCGMENIVVIPVIPPVNVEANKENVEVNEGDKEYVDEVIADVTENDAVANAVTNVELNADSIAAAKEKLDAPEGAEVVTTVSVKLIGFEVANGSALKMSFDVEPVAIYNNNSAKLENLTSAVTFRLPVSSKATSANAAVYHEDELMGVYEIEEESGSKYVEVSSKTFSTYTVDASVNENYAIVENVVYSSLDDAIKAANAMTGDVTVEIYGKLEYSDSSPSLTGSYDKISFVGKTDDAEICITRDGPNGYIVSNNTVEFSDLILSKDGENNSQYDAGHMNCYFSIKGGTQFYTNCKFPDGACADYATATYTQCEFYNTDPNIKYSLWVYDKTNITVDNCKFTGLRGIKMYQEDKNTLANYLTVKNTDFSKTTDGKPAIVLTYGAAVTLSDNEYKSTGVFELDLGGNPDGTLVSGSDVASAVCVNDNGACGVIVDGKIYTTVADAAEVATDGSVVTLLHNSTETVEFVKGVELNKNGFTADGVTVKKAVTVAKIGDVEYSSLMAALQDVKSDDTVITLYKDVTEPITSIRGKIVSGSENGVTITSTHNDWLYAAYNFTIDTGVTFNCPYLFLYCNKGVINGKLCISGQYYQMYANTGLYINAPGSMVITGENAILRYTDGNVNTGIFINGDNDDKTVEFKAPYISFYQGLISAKDAVIEVATIWQTNTTDGKGSANFVLDNSIIRQTTNELQFGADGSANIELKNNSFVKLAANPNIAASVYVAADATSDITVNNKSIFGAAILNSSKYLTFANAYEKAAANDIITLNANVQNEFTVSKEITIMLNGYTANIVAGEGYELTSDDESNTIKVIPVSYVAQIGDAKFSSLAEAIEAAESGNTITLLEDIETSETYTIAADKEITLDLNGKKIIATDTKASDNYELFYNYGTFTVQSSVDGGLIELTAENNRNWKRSSSIIHNRGGILTVKSGELKHNGGTDMAYAIDNSGNSYGDAATNIEGGSIYSSYTAIRNRMDEYGMNGGGNGVATVNVFGGEIDGSTTAIWGQVSSASNGKPAKGEINISGGNVGTVNVSRNEYSEAMLNITSGTVTNIKAQNGHVKISGGNVTGTLTILNANGEAVTNDTIISGGIFASDVSDYCVFGYKAEYDSVTGTYGIIDAEVLDTILGYSRHLKGLNPNGIEKYKVHLFAGIDSLKYKNVGYEVTFRGVTKTGESRTVYTSIKGENGTFTPDMFGENSKYIISLDVLFPIDETSADESFTYRVYVTKHTGEKVYSDYKTVNGVYNRK